MSALIETGPAQALQDGATGGECLWCRREAPCECMTLVRDGGPLYEPVTRTYGWSSYPERCMCSCGGCQAPWDEP